MNRYIRYIIAIAFSITGSVLCFLTNSQLNKHFVLNSIETIVSALLIGRLVLFFLDSEESSQKTVLLTMIGIVGGCLSYSITNYPIVLHISSAFFHGLWAWFIAFCLADMFNLLQSPQQENGNHLESNS
ncbi:hypothetical protein BAMA_00085 [Bacillus manliponensis]|uniref:Uncharacterized protein n=1 Tax=Bacillus manliponensis TaxID=574376 RepID=A0A073KFW3_9BACI|nr:DUF3938 domain-containing protein [Bacillus manliponensis]KEK21208.1 hypothetical protein BAMA_00085 [Bacillus manliponensis]